MERVTWDAVKVNNCLRDADCMQEEQLFNVCYSLLDHKPPASLSNRSPVHVLVCLCAVLWVLPILHQMETIGGYYIEEIVEFVLN